MNQIYNADAPFKEGNMVIYNGLPWFIDECGGPHALSGFPNLLHDRPGRSNRVCFLGDPQVLIANHVEQNTIGGTVMGIILREILGANRKGILDAGGICSAIIAHIFQVKQNDVHPDVRGGSTQQASHLKQNSNPGGSIVGTRHG